MIRRRLEELSPEALLMVASRNGLELDPDLEREQLVDELLEIIAENREDQRRNNSSTVRIQQTKYVLIHEDESPASDTVLVDNKLPAGYEINRIVLMLRDPHWAYTYWDLSSAKRTAYQNSSRFDGLFLRVLELSGDEEQELRIRESFEIPVQLTDSSWYIYLPHQAASYRIQLVARNNHRRELLAVSNRIFAPRSRIPSSPQNLDPVDLAVFELCGLEYLEVPPFGDGSDG